MQFEVFGIEHRLADIWIASDYKSGFNYCYGGTRVLSVGIEDHKVINTLLQLMIYESALKNRLINKAIRNGAIPPSISTPNGFMESMVGGARCVIRPKNQDIASILANPNHDNFQNVVSNILEPIGKFLNEQGGVIKLTPDFGRFAGVSDSLHNYTEHVLGVKREVGGCGGKSSYSATGIIAALEAKNVQKSIDLPITLIGSEGAMGSIVQEYFLKKRFLDIAVSDLVHTQESIPIVPTNIKVLPAEPKMFTDACLNRGGVIVATTVGHELENSNWQTIPAGTLLFLAHNLALPTNESGIALARSLADQGVMVFPGQILTLGGALTSRLEWFWRQTHPGQLFDKPLAHSIVKEVVSFLIHEISSLSTSTHSTPYEAMLSFADIDPMQSEAYGEVDIRRITA